MTDATAIAPASPCPATSGWIPVALAGAAVAVLASHLSTGPREPAAIVDNGAPPQEDNRTARLWQLLMLLQVPCVLYFAAWWLPRDPRRTLSMLGVQGFAFVAAALPAVLPEL